MFTKILVVNRGEIAIRAVRAAFARIRQDISFMERDRAMDADVRRITELVDAGAFDSGNRS